MTMPVKVSVRLKKRLVYKSSERSQLINPELLYKALLELTLTNHHYKVKRPMTHFCCLSN